MPSRPRLRDARGFIVRNLARDPDEPEVPVVQRGDRRRVELPEDPFELRYGRVGVDDLARHGVDALRRHRADEHVSVAIEDAAAAREDLDGVGALRERLARVDGALDGLDVVEPPREKERDDQTRIEEEPRAHRSDARERSLMHPAPR